MRKRGLVVGLSSVEFVDDTTNRLHLTESSSRIHVQSQSQCAEGFLYSMSALSTSTAITTTDCY